MNKTPLSKTEIDLIRYWIWSGAKADTKLSEALKLGDLPKKTDDL